MKKELWKDIAGEEGRYQISNLGRVKSLARRIVRRNGAVQTFRERILKPGKVNKRGHLIVNLGQEGHRRTVLVHRLVLEAFVGPCPNGKEGCHWDDDPGNNGLDNLRWDTRKANAEDSIRNGGRDKMRGENRKNAKLNNKTVLEIRRLYETGKFLQQDLATMFGTNFVRIHKVVRRKIWQHI